MNDDTVKLVVARNVRGDIVGFQIYTWDAEAQEKWHEEHPFAEDTWGATIPDFWKLSDTCKTFSEFKKKVAAWMDTFKDEEVKPIEETPQKKTPEKKPKSLSEVLLGKGVL